MEKLRFICPCLFGIEGLVARELRDMDCENVKTENGRVIFEGGLDILARANINSRYSERIGIVMGIFTAKSFEELFENVKRLPWERWINKKDSFPVKGWSLNSQLSSIPHCQSIIKKAVVERLKQKYKIEWFEETGPLHQIQFSILKDTVTVILDTTGDGLHKRGYRANASVAPIKETLAAAMANLAHVRGDSIVYDPLCGSGTILIESALLALNIAPGLGRSFAAEKWSNIPESIWKRERERALDSMRFDNTFEGIGSDIDRACVELSAENAKKAGVKSRLKFKQADISNFTCESQKGIVICNPPYGERLMEVADAEEIYKTMGKVFNNIGNFSYYIISPHEDFEGFFGKVADKRRKLYNGMIKCQLYMYFR